VESRVRKLVSDKFDEVRRKRLSARLGRYVKEFSRCSQAWVASNMVQENGVSVPRWLVERAAEAAQTPDFDMNEVMTIEHPAPPCMAQLEGHMSLERDEWFDTDKGTLSALFLPFANMHTQLLGLLADYPDNTDMQWDVQLQTTAAGYGKYILDHLAGDWKAQVCRQIRLRTSVKVSHLGWRYQLVVLKPVPQPHAAEECSAQCGGESGWCDFCGGKNVGACCQKGDGGVCARFDTPVGWYGSAYKACVHTDCIQSNAGYYGKAVAKFNAESDNDGELYDADNCQAICAEVESNVTTDGEDLGDVMPAVAFTLTEQGAKCSCFAMEGISRHQEQGAFSGPVHCDTPLPNLKVEEEVLATRMEETPTRPIEEVEVCEKSPAQSNFAAVEENNPEWLKGCYKNATKVVMEEYNEFYKKFAEFIDRLGGASGCGMETDRVFLESQDADKDAHEQVSPWLKVSDQNDAGSFASCDWKLEQEMDANTWVLDATDRSRGWTGTSQIQIEEQQKIQMQFPMPLWLRAITRYSECFANTAEGHISTEPDDDEESDMGGALNAILEPAGQSDADTMDALQQELIDGENEEDIDDMEDSEEDMSGVEGDMSGGDEETAEQSTDGDVEVQDDTSAEGA